MADLRAGVALDPGSPAVQLAAARIELHRGMRESAVLHYRVALERNPGELEAMLGLAVALERSGHADEAAATVERIAAGEPSIQRLVTLAAAASVTVDAAAGIGLLRAATRLRPDDPELQLALGRVLAADRRSTEALACYRRALELQPRSADSANSLAMLLATADDPAVRDPQAALSLARELSAAAGGRHPVLLGTLGVTLASAGQRAEVEKALAEAAAIARRAGHPELAASLDRQLEQVQQGWPPPPAPRNSR